VLRTVCVYGSEKQCGTACVDGKYRTVGPSVKVRKVPTLWNGLCVDSRYFNADKNTNKCVLIAEVTLNDRQDWCGVTHGRKRRPADHNTRCLTNKEPLAPNTTVPGKTTTSNKDYPP
jgi:hypothetical protein